MKSVVFLRSTGIFNDSRSTKEILALSEAGFDVTVLSWDRFGNAQEKNSIIFRDVGNVNFIYFKEKMTNGIGLKNIKVLIKWIKWIKKTLKQFGEIDCIHACDLDTSFAALSFLKKHKKIKFVYDIFDYYVDSHKVPLFVRKYVEKKEIAAINLSDITLICTEERRKQIALSKPKKIVVIHNSPEIKELFQSNAVYDYVYCGSMGSRRLLKEILEKYPEHSHLKFYFAGYGQFSALCKELSQNYENFSFDESISYNEVLKRESEGRVLSAIYEPTIRNHKLCAPNKFYEAMALSKPVIVCNGTGIDLAVKKYCFGFAIDYSADEFYMALEKLLDDQELISKLGQNGRKLYETNYSWGIMKKRLVDAYVELLEE